MTSAEKSARYRAKDIEGYREKKNALARLPHHKAARAAYQRKYRAARRLQRKPRQRKFTDEQIKERKRLSALKYREAHREELRRKSLAYYEKYRRDGSLPSRLRRYTLRKKYGITPEEYERIFESQGRKCVICSISVVKRQSAWHVDHCHKTGKVRGILCHVCNTKLGWFEKFRDQINGYLNPDMVW